MAWQIILCSSIAKWVQLFKLDRFTQLHREDKLANHHKNIKITSRLIIIVEMQVSFSLEMEYNLLKTVINTSYKTWKTLTTTITMTELMKILTVLILKLRTSLISSSSHHRRLSKTARFIHCNNIEGNLNKPRSL